MILATADFESEFAETFTLKSLSTEAYIRDERFRALGCSIKWGPDANPHWYTHDELLDICPKIDWAKVGLIGHHLQFDALIFSHHYQVVPAFYFCTLSYARLLLGNHLSVSLDNLAKHFNMSGKTINYNLFRGKSWVQLTPHEQQELAAGCNQDVNTTWELFKLLVKQMPREELAVVDATIRMFACPTLIGDIDLLAQIWTRESVNKADRLKSLNVTAAELQSSDKFADLLRAEGIEPETKNGKNKPIYAFAKTDQFMRDLLEDDNDRVRTLAEARLGQKSTLMQTRAETLGFMARRGPMPVYLLYAGAHTTRWSGGDGANWQNFKRGSDLRRAILPPKGFRLIKPDLSQVECRLLNYLAGQDDVTEKFKRGLDPYTGIASEFYGRPITRNDPLERGTGKQAELSCGYGCGPPKFQATARLGIYGPPVILALDEAERFVALYRRSQSQVTNYWRDAEKIIGWLANGESGTWGPMRIADRRIWLPNGAPLIYDTLEWYVDDDTGDRYWRMKTRNGWTKLYGAKLVEQTTQALARVLISQAMLRLIAKGYRICNSEHDSLWILIPEDGHEQQHMQICIEEMSRTPEWLPGLPLAAEIAA